MKVIKRLSVALLALVMLFCVFACTPTTKKPNSNGGGGDNTSSLTPDSITKLKAITNYGAKAEHYKGTTVTYADTTAEKAKLSARIEEKKTDAAKEDASSIIKIFAASDADGIIAAMQTANLPADKMKLTVDYMAGNESVSDDEIAAIVETGKFDKNLTKDWSFFDDWSYYEKLDERAKNGNTTDEDNVKRQYRNILGKVFEIGMTGDQFARLAVHELVYATKVVEKMASDSGIANAKLQISTSLNEFDTYCQNELDYETLVYLRAFNEYYNLDGSGNGLVDCVELYGYYYEYNRTDYYSQTDEEFETQLKYGHYTVFSDAEWLEYVKLQRKSYTSAYRYDDAFYNTFYTKHFAFQTKIEKHEEVVYNIEKWNGKSYTAEMQNAIRDGGLSGQLNFTDWIWCYAGNDAAMRDYNAANTANENGKKEGALAEQKYNGEFAFDMEQLKLIYYILDNMSTPNATNLSRTLRFQVYSYSGEMVKSAQAYKKDSALVTAMKIAPEDATKIPASITSDADKKEYAVGKIDAILGQMETTYTKVNVTSAANNAANQPWVAMRNEVKAAIDKDYSSYTGKAKLEALEDMVIKKKWNCGGTEEECGKPQNANRGHVGCEKVYDENHNISKFVSNYEVILRHMAGSVTIKFQNDAVATATAKNNYAVNVYPSGEVKYTAGFKGTISYDMVKGVERINIRTISLSSGKTFAESIKEAGGDDLKWWNSKTPGTENSVASKAVSSGVSETNPENNKTGNYTYTYAFAGWYLDDGLKYSFDPEDKINCDLILYAGYDVTKQG